MPLSECALYIKNLLGYVSPAVELGEIGGNYCKESTDLRRLDVTLYGCSDNLANNSVSPPLSHSRLRLIELPFCVK